MAKHDSNPKLIDGFYLLAFGLCAPGDEKCDRTPPDRREVAVCKRWLRRNAAPRKTVNRFSHSYSLKHVVERTSGEHIHYVTNGALILAAIELGYRCKRIRNTPNAAFNMKLAKS
jgi:hypothetical protein